MYIYVYLSRSILIYKQFMYIGEGFGGEKALGTSNFEGFPDRDRGERYFNKDNTMKR